jgi:hypothetical protein
MTSHTIRRIQVTSGNPAISNRQQRYPGHVRDPEGAVHFSIAAAQIDDRTANENECEQRSDAG